MYVKVKGQWIYLYRVVDLEGNTIDFYLSESRDKQAAQHFFKKVLVASHICKSRVITIDKNPAYPIAIQELNEVGFIHKLFGIALYSVIEQSR